MTELFKFASDNPILTFCIVWMSLRAVQYIIQLPFRALNIWKHGWPPEPLDADGDVHHKPTQEDA